MRINILLNAIGLVLKYAGLFFLLPIIVAVVFKEYTAIIPFIVAFLASEALGFLLTIKKAEEKELNSTNKKEALAIVFFAWLTFGLVCAIPYLFSNFSVINALFEAISGITTTGSTIISDFSNVPKTLFFYRSMSQWLGGMGIIVLFIAILPQFSIAGRQMFFGEAPIPIEEKITPRIRSSASWLWRIYLLLTILEILLLVFWGKNDAGYLNHIYKFGRDTKISNMNCKIIRNTDPITRKEGFSYCVSPDYGVAIYFRIPDIKLEGKAKSEKITWVTKIEEDMLDDYLFELPIGAKIVK